MNTGRISYNMTQRSVRKPMKSGSGLLPGFVRYRDCAVVSGKNGDQMVTAVLTGTIGMAQEVRLLFCRGENQILCQGGRVQAISAAIVIPTDWEESRLADVTAELSGLCRKAGADFAQMHVTAAEQIAVPVLTLSFLGELCKEECLPEPGAAILAVGHAGMAGVAILAQNGREALKKRYAGAFLEKTDAWWNELSLRQATEALDGFSCYRYPVQEGGVLAALWYLADGLGKGFDISMKQIPIRQQTVEICEFYRINPYQLAGDGMMLVVTEKAEECAARLQEKGMEAVLLGFITADKAKILRNEEEVRYLDKPARDELETFRQKI
ncbi:MAG: hypothetical protein IJ468_13350 [Lachnospiraceae bacterium]|nr:hypothetical protein [Lachnospiraceae bacterium]